MTTVALAVAPEKLFTSPQADVDCKIAVLLSF
jgi:hypothetical protein